MPLTLPPSTRTRSRRWEALRDLVAHIDALVAINVHVDSLLVSGHSIVADVVTFERELERVRTALLYEDRKSVV